MVTKKIAVEFTEKEIKKEFKHFTTKKLFLTPKKVEMQEMRDKNL